MLFRSVAESGWPAEKVTFCDAEPLFSVISEFAASAFVGIESNDVIINAVDRKHVKNFFAFIYYSPFLIISKMSLSYNISIIFYHILFFVSTEIKYFCINAQIKNTPEHL